MPSLSEMLTQETSTGEEMNRKICGAGLLKLNPDLLDSEAASSISTVSKVTTTPSAKQLDRFRRDHQDFNEFKWQLNADEDVELAGASDDAASGNQTYNSGFYGQLQSKYFDVQRLFIQERGEEKYYDLQLKKKRAFQSILDDQFRREELLTKLQFFTLGNTDTVDKDFNDKVL